MLLSLPDILGSESIRINIPESRCLVGSLGSFTYEKSLRIRGKEKLIGEVVGISSCSCLFFPYHVQLTASVPASHGRSGKSFSLQLLHAGGDFKFEMVFKDGKDTTKTLHKEGKGADVIWHPQFGWEYDIDDKAFLRFVLFAIDCTFFFPKFTVCGEANLEEMNILLSSVQDYS